MKPNLALKPILKPIFVSTLLCGALLSPVLADTSTDTSTVPTPTIAHHYVFTAAELDSDVYVRLTDDNDEDFNPIVVEVVAEAGGLTKIQRAQSIASSLQKASDADPTFIDHLKVEKLQGGAGEVVVTSTTLQDKQWFVTADARSKRTVNAPTREVYAQWIVENIQNRLKGVKLRDAAFDYELKGDQKKQRAYEYYKQAQDAYADKDTDVAVSKYQMALKLSPDYNYCRLKLANLYLELNQAGDKDKARELYQQVADAVDADVDDKKAAADKLHGLAAAKS